MGYTAPNWANGKPPAINATRLNDLCSTVQTLDKTMPKKQDKLTFDNVPTSGSSNPVKSSGIYTALQGKQSSLTFDNAPTSGSSNPVKSSGIYTALQGKQSSLTFDSTPIQGSTNPVTSGGVYGHRVVAGQKEGETLGTNATSEGTNTIASGASSHAEGGQTTASGSCSHSEGNQTASIGSSSHAEGIGRLVSVATINGPINANETTYQVGTSAGAGFRIGYSVKGTVGSNSYFASVVSKASGSITLSASLNPDAALTSGDTLTIYKIEGVALTDGSHAEGLRTIASGLASHSEGTNTISAGSSSHSEGAFTNSIGDYSHSEGNNTTASGNSSHSEGANTTASGNCSHAEGQNTTAAGDYSHAEGVKTEATADYSHSEGYETTAESAGCHSEGMNTVASGKAAHSEGVECEATGDYSHSEGYGSIASGMCSHAEGSGCEASGECSSAGGSGTVAEGVCQRVFGQHNISNTTDVEIVGWGTSTTPKNIRTLDQSGNMTIAGTLTQSSDAKLKTVEGEIPDVSEIHAVRFRWNDVNGQHDDIDHVGYIAQDVEEVAPFMVKEDSNGYKALDYIAFLCAKMEFLERRVKELEEKKE